MPQHDIGNHLGLSLKTSPTTSARPLPHPPSPSERTRRPSGEHKDTIFRLRVLWKYVCIHIYIYKRERERERSIFIYIHIWRYASIDRERERERERESEREREKHV